MSILKAIGWLIILILAGVLLQFSVWLTLGFLGLVAYYKIKDWREGIHE